MLTFIHTRILFFSAIFFIMLFSCDNVFHNVQSMMSLPDQNPADQNPNDRNSYDYSAADPMRIFLGGNFEYQQGGLERDNFVVLDQNGYLDDSFLDISQNGLKGTNSFSAVYSMTLTPEYLYIGGYFNGYVFSADDLDSSINSSYQMLQRYDLNGNLDTAFIPADVFGTFYALHDFHVLSTGDILIGGNFIGGISGINSYYSRLNNDGTAGSSAPLLSTAGSDVYTINVSEDETEILLGGIFNDIGGQSGYMNFAKTGSDGSVEPFDSPFSVSASSVIYHIEVSENGSVFLAGEAGGTGFLQKFDLIDNVYMEDKDFVSNFQFDLNRGYDQFTHLNLVRVDRLNRIYIGGYFRGFKDNLYNSSDPDISSHAGIVRLTSSGYIDSSFQINWTGANPEVHAIEFQENGKILVGGIFTYLNGNANSTESSNGIVRLDESGAVDESFYRFAIGSGYDATGQFARIHSIVIGE